MYDEHEIYAFGPQSKIIFVDQATIEVRNQETMDDGEGGTFPFIGRYFKLPRGERVKVKSDFFRTRCEDGTPLESGKA